MTNTTATLPPAHPLPHLYTPTPHPPPQDASLCPLLVPSCQECKAHSVFTQHQALEYLGAKVKAGPKGGFSERRRKSKVCARVAPDERPGNKM